MTHDKRDKNEAEIVKYWRGLGYVWIPQDRNAGFDGILVGPDAVWFVEIKNGKSARLTEAEQERRWQLLDKGWRYYIVTSLADADMILLDKSSKAEL